MAVIGLSAAGHYSRPFPGVLVDAEGVVSSLGLPSWPGFQHGLAFPDRLVSVGDEDLRAQPGPARARALDRGRAARRRAPGDRRLLRDRAASASRTLPHAPDPAPRPDRVVALRRAPVPDRRGVRGGRHHRALREPARAPLAHLRVRVGLVRDLPVHAVRLPHEPALRSAVPPRVRHRAARLFHPAAAPPGRRRLAPEAPVARDGDVRRRGRARRGAAAHARPRSQHGPPPERLRGPARPLVPLLRVDDPLPLLTRGGLAPGHPARPGRHDGAGARAHRCGLPDGARGHPRIDRPLLRDAALPVAAARDVRRVHPAQPLGDPPRLAAPADAHRAGDRWAASAPWSSARSSSRGSPRSRSGARSSEPRRARWSQRCS